MADFLLFEVQPGNDEVVGPTPSAVIYRIDDGVINRLKEMMVFVTATIPIAPHGVRWLSRARFDSQGNLESVPGFFDKDVDSVICLGSIEIMDRHDDGANDMGDDVCQVYESIGQPVLASGLTINQTQLPGGGYGYARLAAFGETPAARQPGHGATEGVRSRRVIVSCAESFERIVAQIPLSARDRYANEVLRQPRLIRALLEDYADRFDMHVDESAGDYLRRCAEDDFGAGQGDCLFPVLFDRAVAQMFQQSPVEVAKVARMLMR